MTDPNLLQKDEDIPKSSNDSSCSNNINNSTNNGNLPAIFDAQEEIDDISASIDFSTSSPFYVSPAQFTNTQQDQFDDFSSPQSQMPLTSVVANGLPPYPNSDLMGPLMVPPLPSIVEECISSAPCSTFLPPTNPTFMPGPGGNMNVAFCADTSGIFPGNIVQPQKLDYRGDGGGFYYPDSKPQIFNPGDIQALSIESQKLLNGNASTPTTPLPPEMSAFEDPTFKVGKLSVEERKEKIHRYLKKRNERNFSKKIKYACRKTLADSRPRVRGRFAKNDDFGDTQRPNSSSHEEDDDDEVGVKEDDDTMDSSDIFAHISGVNSFKCSYSIQSWI
ncbi:hypothetical protein CDL15_Pgr022021 [Punica granatum]|uniref:CCT domain-containing protein n=1 Tax=Punica granatum TaxID=22663 RepID=A0A218VSE0_PUNGR|nr:hypothetical protein CDL15_Pgr022021 [Punica granatum]